MKGSKKNKLRRRKRDLVKDFLKKNLKGWKGAPGRKPLTHSNK